jgi:hypothetical protein
MDRRKMGTLMHKYCEKRERLDHGALALRLGLALLFLVSLGFAGERGRRGPG